MISMSGVTGILSIFIFYLSHTTDLATTIMGLRHNPKVFEANPIFAGLHGNVWKIALIKYSFATFILLVIYFVPAISLAILGDTLFEAVVSANNIYQQMKK